MLTARRVRERDLIELNIGDMACFAKCVGARSEADWVVHRLLIESKLC